MKKLLLAATMLISAPAIAQHSGHSAPQRPQADPHAGHSMAAPMTAETPAETETPADMQMNDAPPDSGTMDMPMETPAADPHAGHAMEGMQGMQGMGGETMPPASGPPPEAFTGPAHAADTVFDPAEMAGVREGLRAALGGFRTRGIFIDRLEAQIGNGPDAYLWDLNAWYGGDIDKLWIKSEGEGTFGGELEGTETQALWSHAIGPYFDIQSGVRYDIRPGSNRGHLVLGVQGLAPYFFELDAAAFVSDRGDITARIEAEYDQRITQKLILQPRAEVSFAAQDIPEIGIGSGLSSFEAGLRLRYEFVPEFAPYIGVEWQQKIGDTADFARAAGEDPGRVVFLTGVRIWF